MLSAVMAHSGLRVGLFTSPHLINVTERFRLNDKEIKEEELERIAQRVEQQILAFIKISGATYTPSFFEVLILVALEYFTEAKAELVIFEAGIGGKSDAVSLLIGTIGVITTIGKDHIKKLGPTLEHIAVDKAGIVNTGALLLVNKTIERQLKEPIQAYCQENQILYEASRQFVEGFKSGSGGSQATIYWQNAVKNIHLPLVGSFQEENLNLVLSLLSILKEKKLLKSDIQLEGLEKSHWPGRMEFVAKAPDIILDAAHNEPALKALLHTLNAWSDRASRVLIFGCSNEKDYPIMVQLATQLAKDIFLVDDFWHAWPAALLSREFEKYPVELRTANTLEALQLARQLFPQKLIIVTGSIFMIGNARKALIDK